MAYLIIQPFSNFAITEVDAYRGCINENWPPQEYAWHNARNYLLGRLRVLTVLPPALSSRDSISLQLARKLHEVVKADLLIEENGFPEFAEAEEPNLPPVSHRDHLLAVCGGIDLQWWKTVLKAIEAGEPPIEPKQVRRREHILLDALGIKFIVPLNLQFRLYRMRKPRSEG